MRKMSNQVSSIPLEDFSAPQRCTSRFPAHSNIQGDYSANIGTSRLANNRYYNHDPTNSSSSYREILQCLYTSRYESHRNRVPEPVDGTCIWVTEHPKYKDWLGKGASGTLWLSADPGCGKSVIASFLTSHLKVRTDAIVCYFFFKDDNNEQGSAKFALCAILHQLFSQRTFLCSYAEEEFRAKGKGFTEEMDALWGILVKAVAEGGCGDVICVVDALDECEDVTLSRLIRHITRLSASQTRDMPLRFLVTSRPRHRIREFRSLERTIHLKGEGEVNSITADVTRVIEDGIRNLESYWGNPGELGYLQILLKSSANQTFLWISLVLELLRDSEDDSRGEFTNIISTAPRDLAGLYTKILDKSAHPDEARRILHIMVAAARPLTLREMNVAFRINKDHKKTEDIGDPPSGFHRRVKSLCGLFVRVIDSKIYLVHQTAREFLIKGASLGLGNWQYTLSFEDSHYVLARICISYLSLEEFENDPLVIDLDHPGSLGELTQYKEKYALLDYAANYWADHFRDSQTQQKELFELTRLICKGGSNRFRTWLGVYWSTRNQHYPFPIDFTNLMIASWFGQLIIVERLLEEGGDINARSERYGTALNIAAMREDEVMTNMLVDRNVKAYICGKEYNISQTKRSELDVREGDDWVLKACEFLERFCIPDTPDPHVPGTHRHAPARPPSAGTRRDSLHSAADKRRRTLHSPDTRRRSLHSPDTRRRSLPSPDTRRHSVRSPGMQRVPPVPDVPQRSSQPDTHPPDSGALSPGTQDGEATSCCACCCT